MEIILHYKDMSYNGTYQDSYQPYGILEPRQSYGECVIDYDYKVDIDENDIIEFLVSEIGESIFKNWNIEKRNGFKRAIEMVFGKDLFSESDLVENESFIEFMLEKYREDAEYECQQDYGD